MELASSPMVQEHSSEETTKSQENPLTSFARKVSGPRFGRRTQSNPDLYEVYSTAAPPVPMIPQRFITEQLHDTMHQQITRAGPSHMEYAMNDQPSRKADEEESPPTVLSPPSSSSGTEYAEARQVRFSRVPRGTARVVNLHKSQSEHHLPLHLQQSVSGASGTDEKPLPALPSNPTRRRVTFAPIKEKAEEEGEDDVVSEAKGLCYWAGRFTAKSDSLRNEALLPASQLAHGDVVRHNRVLRYLRDSCATREAEESLAAFVQAWRGGWTGGVAEPCHATLQLVEAPKPLPPGAWVAKKGLMERVFRRK
ncbi:MAG: hypothetical protein Q9219_006280 [cf. Caloplaca sp. 3 TL-2023]